MAFRVLLLVAFWSLPGYALEACAITQDAELIAVGKLNGARVWPLIGDNAIVSGKLHLAGLVSGELPASRQVRYVFLCEGCPDLTLERIEHMTNHYGVWFLSRSSFGWTSVWPRSDHPGWAPLGRLEGYKNCLQGRRFSDRD